uniref:ParB-like N-terminal domain-containing protein n=1 Tax=viral metagenome TaxID=1070528 RepID=A0A6M3LKL4_9ZZZZ
MSKPDISHIEPDLRALARPIDGLEPDSRQARAHGERSVSAISASLKAHGQKKPIVVTASGVVVAGHGTIEAARLLGWSHLAAVTSGDSPEELRAFALRDNQTALLSEWDTAALLAELEALSDLGTEPAELGWSAEEMAALVVAGEGEIFETIDGTSTDRDGQGVQSSLSSMGAAKKELIQIGDTIVRVDPDRFQRLSDWLSESFEQGRPYADSVAIMIDGVCPE